MHGTALHADGTPHPDAANIDGTTIRRLTYRKCVTEYPGLATSPGLEYFILACEEGWRWGPDRFRLVRDLVRLKGVPIHSLLSRWHTHADGGIFSRSEPKRSPQIALWVKTRRFQAPTPICP